MGKIGKFISAIADAVKDLVSEDIQRGRYPEVVTMPEPILVKTTLPMMSRDKEYKPLALERGVRTHVDVRPQTCAFRAERIIINEHPEDWVINDIKVGNRSQLAQRGDLPGVFFGRDAKGTDLYLETCQTAMDFTLEVTYVGSAERKVFEATVFGSAAN